MTTDDQIPTLIEACNLGDAERESRVARFRRELLPLATSTEILPDGRAWEFPRRPELERQLEALVTFERVCCPSLGWTLLSVRNGTALRLELTGIDPGQELGTDSEAGRPKRRRLVAIGSAVGIAASVSLPILLAAGGATTIASAMVGFDDLRWIGAVAVITGLAAWRMLERRDTKKGEKAAADCGC